MKKAQSMGLAIISAIGIFIIGFMFLNFLMPEITQFRTSMSCASPDDITDGAKVLCLVTDATVPYFILLVLSISIGAITSKVVFG